MNDESAFILKDDIALVTGGGTGLGQGIAKALAGAGARIVVAGRRQDVLQRACETIGVDRCVAVTGDITDDEDRAIMLDRAANAFGSPVTILVNNAGVHLKKPAAEVSDDEFQAVMSTHVNAGFALARGVHSQMFEAGRGSIVFLASMTSLIGMPSVVAYTAAKCAVAGLTRALAAEWAPHGVRVNAIAPGWIESPMLRQALSNDLSREQKILSRTPMAGFGEPRDIGQAAVYLCSPAGKFINGIILPVDGGASMAL